MLACDWLSLNKAVDFLPLMFAPIHTTIVPNKYVISNQRFWPVLFRLDPAPESRRTFPAVAGGGRSRLKQPQPLPCHSHERYGDLQLNSNFLHDGENFGSMSLIPGADLRHSTSISSSIFESRSGFSMMLSLTLRVLLVGNLLYYSAGLEGTNELSHEKLSHQEEKLLAVPSQSPNSYPTYPTYFTYPTAPTYPVFRYPNNVPIALPTSLPIKTTAYPTSLDTLSGYYVEATYSDSSCKALYDSKSVMLNTCLPDGFNYRIVVATSSFINKAYYFDSECKRAGTKLQTAYTPGSCVNKQRIIISPTIAVASTNATCSMK